MNEVKADRSVGNASDGPVDRSESDGCSLDHLQPRIPSVPAKLRD